MSSGGRVGVFIDNENIVRCGGFGMKYDVLRKFACRGGAEPIRLNTYIAFDSERARTDKPYDTKTGKYLSTIRDYGFKVILKEVKWIFDEQSGKKFGKANADLDMAVDVLLQSENLDRILLVTGDGDFVQVVRALQNKGCRVEVLGFDNVSGDLKRECDMFVSGYLIPGLLPMGDLKNTPHWGESASKVRGTCCYLDTNRNFGLFRYLHEIGDLWISDSRDELSPYRTATFQASNLPKNAEPQALPSHERIFEFTLGDTDREGDANFQATDIKLFRRF